MGHNDSDDHDGVRRRRHQRLGEWMDAHDGTATTDVLKRLRFSKREIDGMVARGELVRTRRGLYRGRGVRQDLQTELRGALARHGDDARLMSITALHWQGYLNFPATVPEIGVPGDSGPKRLRGRIVYYTPSARPDAIVHNGLDCAAPVDALPHLASLVRGRHATRRALRRAVREAVRRDHRLLARLEAVAARRAPGSPELRDALGLLPGAAVVRSDMEEDFIAFCEIWGLPPFLMNQKVGGVERDAVRRDERVIVELDTRGYHDNAVSFESDRRRRREATVAKWRHIEITGPDLGDEPVRVATDLAVVLELKDWSPPLDAARRWADVVESARGVWLAKR